jgi:hypothetical protein
MSTSGKKLVRLHLSQLLGVVTYTCRLSYIGGINRRIEVQTGQSINVSFYAQR